jgi:RimJ/RimL family protein N-acetyltransferase
MSCCGVIGAGEWYIWDRHILSRIVYIPCIFSATPSHKTLVHHSPLSNMTIKGQATLHTSRLELVPLRNDHREHTMKLDMDPEVMKTVAFGRPFTEDEAKQVHTWLMKSAQTFPGFGCWAGFSNGEFVGWWIIAAIPEPGSPEGEDGPQSFQSGKTEYGFRVAPKFWGKGFAKEGAREMVRHAFEDLHLDEVVGETMTVNAASRAVMAGSGLKHVETFFNTYDTPPAGIEEGEVRYVIKREDWLSSQRIDEKMAG